MRFIIADNELGELAALLAPSEMPSGLVAPIVVASGTDALKQIRLHRPEVALLSCELTDMTGFDVLRHLDVDERPETIMIAPDDRYATEALSSAANDYLTRPISPARLALALRRACSSAHRAIQDAAARQVTANDATSTGWPGSLTPGQRLVGERAGRIYFFAPAEIDYIEADSNYMKIHVGTERFINRDSLTRLSALLGEFGFLRISRSVLLNLQRVSFAEREGSGILAFALASGTRVVSSAGFRLESGAQLRIARTRGIRGGKRSV